MKITLVMTGRGAGGVQQSLVTYAEALSKHYNVQVIVWKKAAIKKQLVERNIPFHCVNFAAGKYITKFVQILQLRSLLKGFNPDLVIGFLPHGYRELTWASYGARWLTVARIGVMSKWRVAKTSRADAWIANSKDMAAFLEGVGFSSDRIVVVENFLPINTTIKPRRTMNSPIAIGAAGRFVRRKGFDLLLHAAKALDERGVNLRWTLAGNGPGFLIVQRLAARLGLQRKIEFLGWLSEEGKESFYSELDIFVCPSIDDPFPRVLLEAMRYGVPIVTTANVGARTIFQDNTSALVTSENTATALATEIEKLAMSKELRMQISRNSQKLFEKVYTLNAGERRLLDAASALKNLQKRR